MKLPTNKRINRASVLIIALWSISILSVFAVILGSQVRQKLIMVKRLEDRSTARLIAEAGTKKAAAVLAAGERNQVDTLNQPWSSNPAEFKDAQVGNGRFEVSYKIDSGETFYGLTDEESKININKASVEVLERLFAAAGLEDVQAQDLAYSIVDWRDADSELSGPAGAEDSYYRSLPVPYESKDAPFELIDELLLVKGVDENIFQKVKKYTTIYGDGRVNVNTASRPVLIALGYSENVADRIIAFRNGKDSLPGTSDDNQFAGIFEVATKLQDTLNLSQSEQAAINNIASEGAICFSSNNFMVRSIAILGNRGKAACEVVCVIDRKGRIYYWNES